MRRALCFTLSIVALCVAARAAAETYFETPAGMPRPCDRFQGAMIAGGESAIMAQLSGVWIADVPVPAQPGVFEATIERIRTTRYPDGRMLYEEYQCFHPVSVPGLPPLQTRCATAMGHGYWFAGPGEGGWIRVGAMQEGSGFGGNHVGPNCAIIRARLLDPNTIQNEFGVVGRRAGNI